MAVIPIDPAGSPVQYPLFAAKRFHNMSVRFIDGAEQCFRSRRSPSLRWRMNYSKQNETELATWLAFIEEVLGADSTFAYHDPVANAVHQGSRLTEGSVDVEQVGVDAGRFEIEIRKEGS